MADREEMLEYARKNDPWPFHLDEEAAKATPFGGLIASGGYTFTLWYRSAIPILTTFAHYGSLPDWRFLFLHPVRPGDRLKAKLTILKKRPSRNPARKRGYVAVAWEVFNQENQVVLTVNLELIIKNRDSGKYRMNNINTDSKKNDLYKELAARHGFPESKLLWQIFKKMVTPKQVEILLQLPAADSAVIAEKTGIEKDAVDKHLQEMFEKGIALHTRKGWRLSAIIDSLHDMTLSNKKYHESYDGTEFYDLWNAFGKLDNWPNFVKLIQGRKEPFMRVLPAIEAVKDHPELIPEEDIRYLYSTTNAIALIPCACRVEMYDRTCGSPDDMCIAVNRSAEYHFKRGVGRRLTQEEAIEFDKTVRKHNAVAVIPNGRDFNMVMCNCHECCCVGFRAFKENGCNLKDLHAPSRFLAVVDDEKCIGCQKCLEVCNYEAVELRKYKTMKKWKAYVEPEMCMGCGNCVIKCPKDAISFKVVRPPEYIIGSDEEVDIYAYTDDGKDQKE